MAKVHPTGTSASIGAIMVLNIIPVDRKMPLLELRKSLTTTIGDLVNIIREKAEISTSAKVRIICGRVLQPKSIIGDVLESTDTIIKYHVQ